MAHRTEWCPQSSDQGERSGWSRCSQESRAWLHSWCLQQAFSFFVRLASFGGEKRTTDVINLAQREEKLLSAW